MKYSETANILTIDGWVPISKAEDDEYIIFDMKHERMGLRRWNPAPVISKSSSNLKIESEYIDTIVSSKDKQQAYSPIIACSNMEHTGTPLSAPMLYLFGMILTDAYYAHDGHIEIYQSAKKANVLKKIKENLEAAKIDYTVHERERGGKHYTFRISRFYAEKLKAEFNLEDRGNPPLSLILLHDRQKTILMEGMMDGDGTWNDWQYKYGVFYKPQIIDFMQILAFTLGYKTKTNSHRKQIYLSQSGYYEYDKMIMEEDLIPKPIHKKMNMVQLDNTYIPILLDNGKIFILG